MAEIQSQARSLTPQQANFLVKSAALFTFSATQVIDTLRTPLNCLPGVVPQCTHVGAGMTGAGILAAGLDFVLDNRVVREVINDVAPLPKPPKLVEDISNKASTFIAEHPTLDRTIHALRLIAIGTGAELVVRLGQMGVHETLASVGRGDLLTDAAIGFAALTLTNLALRSIEPIKKIVQSPELHAMASDAVDAIAWVGNKTIVPLVVNATKPKLKNRDRDSE